jgi:hypothetical protein
MFDQSQYERYASLQDAEQLAPNNSCDDPHLEVRRYILFNGDTTSAY